MNFQSHCNNNQELDLFYNKATFVLWNHLRSFVFVRSLRPWFAWVFWTRFWSFPCLFGGCFHSIPQMRWFIWRSHFFLAFLDFSFKQFGLLAINIQPIHQILSQLDIRWWPLVKRTATTERLAADAASEITEPGILHLISPANPLFDWVVPASYWAAGKASVHTPHRRTWWVQATDRPRESPDSYWVSVQVRREYRSCLWFVQRLCWRYRSQYQVC